MQSILDKAQKVAAANSGKLKYHYICLVCGYENHDIESYYEDEGKLFGTHDICPCCNVQHGYGAETYEDIIGYRSHWLDEMQGAFSSKDLKPENWDRVAQMNKIPDSWL